MTDAREAVERTAQILADRDEAFRRLEALATMADGDTFPTGGEPFYTALGKALGLKDWELTRLF